MARLTYTVVIASVGRAEDLRGALQSVATQSVAPDHTIVVAQRQDTPTQEVARQMGARVVLVSKPGLALAIETGIKGADGDIVAFLDDDARARTDWLARVIETFEADPSLGLLGGRDNVNGDDVSTENVKPIGDVVRGKIYGNHHLGGGPKRYVLHVKGANMSVRRSAGSQVPISSLVTGSGAQVRNEFILSLGIRRAGYTVAYDPEIQVDHFPAERLGGDERLRVDPSKTFVRRSNEAAALVYAGETRLASAFIIRAVFIGERIAPGLMVLLASGRQWRSTLALFGSAMSGIVDGAARGSRERRGSPLPAGWKAR